MQGQKQRPEKGQRFSKTLSLLPGAPVTHNWPLDCWQGPHPARTTDPTPEASERECALPATGINKSFREEMHLFLAWNPRGRREAMGQRGGHRTPPSWWPCTACQVHAPSRDPSCLQAGQTPGGASPPGPEPGFPVLPHSPQPAAVCVHVCVHTCVCVREMCVHLCVCAREMCVSLCVCVVCVPVGGGCGFGPVVGCVLKCSSAVPRLEVSSWWVGWGPLCFLGARPALASGTKEAPPPGLGYSYCLVC